MAYGHPAILIYIEEGVVFKN